MDEAMDEAMDGPLRDEPVAVPPGPGEAHVARLVRALGGRPVLAPGPSPSPEEPVAPHRAWAASGAMALTGERDGPPRSPGWPLAAALEGAAGLLAVTSARVGRAVDVDGPALLGERAAIAGLTRNGATSPGGACRLLHAADGWIALNLARPEDLELLPAWLGAPVPAGDPWDALVPLVAPRDVAALDERAALLGLPAASVGTAPSLDGDGAPVRVAPARPGPPRDRVLAGRPLVVDLSALWAGPLCASLLGLAGARVVKVESEERPDGARLGPPELFDLLHGGHESVALALRTPRGRAALAALVAAADVVVDSSRPRAMAQLGVDPDTVVVRGGIWVSITAYGRTGAGRDRAGFGDDVAAAAGLIAGPVDEPLCCADAAADPVAGLHAAIAALACLGAGGGWMVDVSMRDALASCLERRAPEVLACRSAAGWVLESGGSTLDVAGPRARPAADVARPFGADTDAVVAAVAAVAG